MPSIYFPQPDFENDLNASDRGTLISHRPAQKLARLIEELEILIGLGADSGDIVLSEVQPRNGELPAVYNDLRYLNMDTVRDVLRTSSESWSFEPWGWSATAIRVAEQLGLTGSEPVASSVKIVNSRQFSAEHDDVVDFESGDPLGLFGRLCMTFAEALSEIRRHGANDSGQWVIKANISHAARNRILGSGTELRHDQRRWLEAQLAEAPVYIEPWVERVAECGLQFMISGSASSNSNVRYFGAAEMINDSTGQYRGSLLRPAQTIVPHDEEIDPGTWWFRSIGHGKQIAAVAAKLGFRGPLGIDCMLFRSEGKLRLRLAHDINGRRTMGRLALSLRRHVPHGQWACWCFASAKSEQLISEAIRESSSNGVQVIPTSPAQLCGRTTTLRTCLLISADWARLNQVAQKILSQDIRGPFHGDFST